MSNGQEAEIQKAEIPETGTKEGPKDIAYYEKMLEAWYISNLERDKSLLLLSGGGIGLLVTLLTSSGVSTPLELIIYMLAILCFVISAISAVFIFDQNPKYLELLHKKETESSTVLRVLDSLSIYSFIGGVILSMAIALSSGIQHLNMKKGTIMSEKKTEYPFRGDSLDGFARMKPEQVEKSFNGVTNMKPNQAKTELNAQPAGAGKPSGAAKGANSSSSSKTK